VAAAVSVSNIGLSAIVWRFISGFPALEASSVLVVSNIQWSLEHLSPR
jgi:hypothetical protein